MDQALHLRSDLTRLREHEPDLAARLDEGGRELDRPLRATRIGGLEAPAAQEQAVTDRRRLARQWDDLVARVRRLDGFEHFLAAVPFTELQAAATAGPVVVVNTSQLGCHALIVTSTGDPGVQPVPLPDLTHQEAVDRANTLLAVLSRADETGRSFLDREADRHAIFDVLEWLWRVIAAPVLETLGYTRAPGRRRGVATGVVVPYRPADRSAAARRRQLPAHDQCADTPRRNSAQAGGLLLHTHLDRAPTRPRNTGGAP